MSFAVRSVRAALSEPEGRPAVASALKKLSLSICSIFRSMTSQSQARSYSARTVLPRSSTPPQKMSTVRTPSPRQFLRPLPLSTQHQHNGWSVVRRVALAPRTGARLIGVIIVTIRPIPPRAPLVMRHFPARCLVVNGSAVRNSFDGRWRQQDQWQWRTSERDRKRRLRPRDGRSGQNQRKCCKLQEAVHRTPHTIWISGTKPAPGCAGMDALLARRSLYPLSGRASFRAHRHPSPDTRWRPLGNASIWCP